MLVVYPQHHLVLHYYTHYNVTEIFYKTMGELVNIHLCIFGSGDKIFCQ